MSSSKVVKNFIYNASYQMLCVITPLITAPYISRVLGPEGIGTINYVQSIATYFVLFGTLGSSLYGQREIAYVQRDTEKRTIVFKEIEILRLITVLIATVLYGVLFCIKNDSKWLYIVFGIEVIASGFDISWFFRGIQDFEKAVIRNFFVRIISVILIFIFVKSPDDILIYALCYAIPIILGNLSLWLYIPKYISKTGAYNLIAVQRLVPLMALFIPQIATEVYLVLDKTMLGILSNNMSEVGFYSQAQRLVQVALKFITALGTVMMPHVSDAFSCKDFKKINKSIMKSMRFVFLISIPMMFGLMGISKNFIPWFLGDGYERVSLLINLMSPTILIIGISNVIGTQYLLSTKQQKKYTVSVFAGMFVNMIFNTLLIPFYGAVGAAIATLLAECSVTIVQILEVKSRLSFIECLKSGIKYIVSGIIMFVAVCLIGNLLPKGWHNTVIQIICGISVYIIILCLQKDELFLEGMDLFLKKYVNLGENSNEN